MVPSPLVHHPCWFPALLNLFHGSITFASFTCASITVDSRLHHLSSITIIWRSQGSITSVPSRGANHMYECMCMTIFVHIHIRIHVLTYTWRHSPTYIHSCTLHTYILKTLAWTSTSSLIHISEPTRLLSTPYAVFCLKKKKKKKKTKHTKKTKKKKQKTTKYRLLSTSYSPR